jgi:hypothetical protein
MARRWRRGRRRVRLLQQAEGDEGEDDAKSIRDAEPVDVRDADREAGVGSCQRE